MFNYSTSAESDNEVATIANDAVNDSLAVLNQPEASTARLSPFSVLRDRKLLSLKDDNSSSDESSIVKKPTISRSRSPLMFTGSRGSEKSRTLIDNKPKVLDEDNNG